MSIQLCLFDLDNTLLRTSDLEVFRGRENVNNTSREYTRGLLREYDRRGDRLLYTPEQLADLQDEFPDMRWGVFTRAPRHYATTLLEEAYPDVEWDIVVAYEDVRNTKPHPEGIEIAARRLLQFHLTWNGFHLTAIAVVDVHRSIMDHGTGHGSISEGIKRRFYLTRMR